MAELAAELSEINDLVTAQVEVGMSRDEVLESLYRSWLDRITELKIKPSNAVTTKLSCAIKSTPFNQEQRTNLARAVLSIGCNTAKKKAAARTNQKSTIWRTSFQNRRGLNCEIPQFLATTD